MVDTLYLIKVVWRADNTMDIYVNGTKEVDNVNTNNNQVSGIDNVDFLLPTTAAYSSYIDGWGNVADSKYVEGYNLGDAYTYPIGNMTTPNLGILQAQHNDFSNIRGGWNEAVSKPFEPTPGTATIAEHIQQYGKLLWRGKRLLSGARTQASFDAIITALKIWEGMVTNPISIEFNIKGKLYYPVGYGILLTFEHNENLDFDPIEDFLIIESIMDFKRLGYTRIIVSNNITRLM